MKFSILTAALPLTVLVAGSPIAVSTNTSSVDEPLEKRAGFGFYACTDEDWKGFCQHVVPPLPYRCCEFLWPQSDKALTLINPVEFGFPLLNLISSIGPDRGTTCNFYK